MSRSDSKDRIEIILPSTAQVIKLATPDGMENLRLQVIPPNILSNALVVISVNDANYGGGGTH